MTTNKEPTATRTALPWLRVWLLTTGVAMTALQFAKFPAMRNFVESQLANGPGTAGVSQAVLDAALDIGVSLGLLIGVVIGWIVLAVVRRQHARWSAESSRRTVFPGWLTGVTSVGLLAPDLFTVLSGSIFTFESWPFLVSYALLVVLAIVFSPAPRYRRLRIVDPVLAVLLLFV